MDEQEFFNKLSTLKHDTSLGAIVGIRLEKDKKIIKGYNSSQRKIYNDWKNKKQEEVKPVYSKDYINNVENEALNMFKGFFK
jgi:hypothetical protein